MATTLRVSGRGQVALPLATRRRWQLDGGGAVEVVDHGDALLIAPSNAGGTRGLLREAIDDDL